MDTLISDIDRIVEYRSVLDGRILYFLASLHSEATVTDIKQLIFEHNVRAHPSKCFADLTELFRADEDDLASLLPVIRDAWNYLPHRSLGGRCPAEVMVDLSRPRRARRPRTIRF